MEHQTSEPSIDLATLAVQPDVLVEGEGLDARVVECLTAIRSETVISGEFIGKMLSRNGFGEITLRSALTQLRMDALGGATEEKEATNAKLRVFAAYGF